MEAFAKLSARKLNILASQCGMPIYLQWKFQWRFQYISFVLRYHSLFHLILQCSFTLTLGLAMWLTLTTEWGRNNNVLGLNLCFRLHRFRMVVGSRRMRDRCSWAQPRSVNSQLIPDVWAIKVNYLLEKNACFSVLSWD